jgi:hypothetical protein
VVKSTKPKAGKSASEKPSKLFRRLSAVLLINSSEFATQTPTAQTATLTKAEGLPILFVPNFVALSDKRAIREKLLSGQDVTTELEFNGINLTDDDRVALKAVLPVLEKIGAIGPSYPWAPEAAEALVSNLKLESNKVRRAGHVLGKMSCNFIWKKASHYWSGGPKPGVHGTRTDGYSYNNRDVTYRPDEVVIGCQTISRAEVEYIARHFGWEPVVFAG